jgi:hypothetical protein
MYAGYFGNVKVADILCTFGSPCRWTVPTTLGLFGSKFTSSFFISVSVTILSAGDKTIVGTSSPYFYIMPPRRYISVSAPVAGKTFAVGRPLRVEWTALASVTQPVSIALYCVDPTATGSSGPFVNVSGIATGIAPDAKFVDWVVPTSVASSLSSCLGYFVSITGVAGDEGDPSSEPVRGESDGLFALTTQAFTPVPGWQLTLLFSGFTQTMIYGTADLDNIFKNTIAAMFELPPVWVQFSSFSAISCSAVVNSTCQGRQETGLNFGRRRRMLQDGPSVRPEEAMPGTAVPGRSLQAPGSSSGASNYLAVSLDVRVPPTSFDYCRGRIEGFATLPNTDGRKVAAFSQLAIRLDDVLGLAPGTVGVAAVSQAQVPPSAANIADAAEASAAIAAGMAPSTRAGDDASSGSSGAVAGGVIGGLLAGLVVGAIAVTLYYRKSLTRWPSPRRSGASASGKGGDAAMPDSESTSGRSGDSFDIANPLRFFASSRSSSST